MFLEPFQKDSANRVPNTIVSGTLFDVERSEIPVRRSPPKAVVAYGSILFLFKYRILILAKPALSLPKGQQQQQA